MKNIAFFGTPDFACPALTTLIDLCKKNHHNLSLVVCQPDRRSGRGQKILPPPVKLIAQEHCLPVKQPESLKKSSESGEGFYNLFKEAQIDLAVVVAYGKIIPKRFLNLQTRFVNLHASLLPRWRGAAPIQRAIESGDVTTGICLMEIIWEMDAGGIYAKKEEAISTADTSGTLAARLSKLGASLLEEKLSALLEGKLIPVPQASAGITHASMLEKSESRINWQQSAEAISRHVRAMTPNPGAYCMLDSERIKLFDPTQAEGNSNVTPGTVLPSKFLDVQTANGILRFGRAQIAGKKVCSGESMRHLLQNKQLM